MLRISTMLGVLFIVALGVISAQNQKILMGAHMEWEGTDEPDMKLESDTHTINIVLERDRECVTVYSPPANKDYTIIIKTPNGTVTAGKPHPEGFQARFCYNIVGEDRILQTHVWLGKAELKGVDGTYHVLQGNQVANFILPHSGQIRYEAGVERPAPGVTPTGPSEYYERAVGTVHVRPIAPRWEEAPQPAPTQPAPTQPAPTQPAPTQPAPTQPTYVPGPWVTIPAVPEEPVKTPEMQPVTVGTQVDPTSTEYKKYYGEKKIEEPEEPLSWYEDFELDHGKDVKIRLDAWLGFQRTRQEGSLRLDGATRGTTLEFGDDLNMEHKDTSLVGGVDLYFMGAHLGFDASGADFEGLTTVPAGGYRLGDTLFAAGSVLESRFEHRWYRGTVGYTVYFNKSVGAGVDFYGEYWKFDARFANNAGQSVSDEIDIFIPSGGIHFDFSPKDRWLITLGCHGVWFDIHDTEIWLVNANAWVRFFPSEYCYLFVRGEWEFDDYQLKDAEDMDLNADLDSVWNASGGIGIRF